MIRKVLIGAVFLVGLMAAPAGAQYEDVVVTPTQVSQGGVVSVSGTSCAPNSQVTITLIPGDVTMQFARAVPAQQNGIVVAELTADENGDFTATFTIPDGTAPGTYTVVTQCGDFTDSTLIEVQADGTTQPTTPGTTPNNGGSGSGSGSGNGGGGTLPRTGSNLNGLGLLGAGLLAAGGLTLIALRKRDGGFTTT